MDDFYSAASGEGIYAGMVAPSTETALETFIAAMSPNTWAEYTGTNINAMLPRDFDSALMGIMESDTNYPISNWANKWAWHPTRKLISGVGTSQGFTIAGGERYSKQVKFGLADNSFSVRWAPTGQVQGHIYDHNCGNFVNDKTWRKASTSGRLGMYDAATDAWALSYDLSDLPSLGSFWGLECSAAHNALYCVESTSGRLVKFDLTTGVRTVIGSYSGIGTYPVIIETGEYIVFGGGTGGTSFYKINAAGTVSLITSTIPSAYAASGNHKFLAHPTTANLVICFASEDMSMRLFDIIVGTFTSIGTLPAAPVMNFTVSTSLKGLGAIANFRGAGRDGGVTQSKFFIYKV